MRSFQRRRHLTVTVEKRRALRLQTYCVPYRTRTVPALYVRSLSTRYRGHRRIVSHGLLTSLAVSSLGEENCQHQLQET